MSAIKALPEAEQWAIVEELLSTLPPDPSPVTDEEFAAELEARAAEFDRDPSCAIPWSEVKKQVNL